VEGGLKLSKAKNLSILTVFKVKLIINSIGGLVCDLSFFFATFFKNIIKA